MSWRNRVFELLTESPADEDLLALWWFGAEQDIPARGSQPTKQQSRRLLRQLLGALDQDAVAFIESGDAVERNNGIRLRELLAVIRENINSDPRAAVLAGMFAVIASGRCDVTTLRTYQKRKKADDQRRITKIRKLTDAQEQNVARAYHREKSTWPRGQKTSCLENFANRHGVDESTVRRLAKKYPPK